MPYLKRKYPMTESSDVNKALDDSVKPIDNTESLENDLLQKSDVVFTFRESGNYNDLIMRLINWMMVSVDSKEQDSKKTVYEEFYNTISGVFNNVYNEGWMNNWGQESARVIPDKSEAKVVYANEKYAAQVKEYTSYVIGRKISKNIPAYS